MKQVQSPTTASLSARAGLSLVIFLPPRVLGLQVHPIPGSQSYFVYFAALVVPALSWLLYPSDIPH